MQILGIRLLTPDLERTRAFYQEALGLPIEDSGREITVKIGTSMLSFEQAEAQAEERTRTTSYHFAFNIPENQIDAGMVWVAERTALIKDGAGTERFNFPNWDAHSCYFADPSGNILELIARHSLNNPSDVPFTSNSLLNISEIGVPVDDVTEAVEHYRERLGVDGFRGSQSPEFAAVGDDNGLLIIVKQGRLWYPDMRVSAEDRPDTITVSHNMQVVTF